MDIRTKLIFTLVAVSLGSMFTFGLLISPRVEGLLQESTLQHLQELADSKREALRWITASWQDRADLVASRTQLRASLEEFSRTGDEAAAARMQVILDDALQASESVSLLWVFDDRGRPVVSATRAGEGRFALLAGGFDPAASPPRGYAGVAFVATGPPHVSYVAPLLMDDQRLGTLIVVFEAHELIELTGHYHGLGETGELLVIAEDLTGSPRTLHPPRHAPAGSGGIVLPRGPTNLATLALTEDERAFDGIADYRGETVWAATRLVPETGWGIVVKVDEVEQHLAYDEFRTWLRKMALIVSAFAILAGFGLGLRFALPIHELAEVANRIRKGEMGARTNMDREDEVGLLARTFDDMADELEKRMALLREFRKFFDVSIDLMCMAGTDGYFKRVNPAFVRELGWSAEELTERQFYSFVHPGDLESTEREVEKLSQGIPTISFENRFMCRDGSYKLLRWASYPDPETGMLYAIAHVMAATGAE